MQNDEINNYLNVIVFLLKQKIDSIDTQIFRKQTPPQKRRILKIARIMRNNKLYYLFIII